MKRLALLLAIPLAPLGLSAQTTPIASRTVQYHSQDIVPIKAKLKYTTLIQVPPTEKIMEAATGDKDFWIVDIVGSFCFVHPGARGNQHQPQPHHGQGKHLQLHAVGCDFESGLQPDLKVIVVPVDASNIVASQGIPAVRSERRSCSRCRGQLANLQQHVESTVDEYKSSYQTQLKLRLCLRGQQRPIRHPDDLTTTTSSPTSRPLRRRKFSVYEMRDGKPNLINYDLRDGTYIIPKVMDNGYVELGKKKMEFSKRKG